MCYTFWMVTKQDYKALMQLLYCSKASASTDRLKNNCIFQSNVILILLTWWVYHVFQNSTSPGAHATSSAKSNGEFLRNGVLPPCCSQLVSIISCYEVVICALYLRCLSLYCLAILKTEHGMIKTTKGTIKSMQRMTKSTQETMTSIQRVHPHIILFSF